MWGVLSDERTGLSPTTAPGHRHTAIPGSEPRGTRDHTPLSRIPYFPLLRLPRLAGLRWRHSTPPPQLETVLLVISRHESQIKHHFLTIPLLLQVVFTLLLHRNGSSAIVACVFITAGMCLLSRYLSTDIYFVSTIPVFRRHVRKLSSHYSTPFVSADIILT
jgi:hypothetical protein